MLKAKTRSLPLRHELRFLPIKANTKIQGPLFTVIDLQA